MSSIYSFQFCFFLSSNSLCKRHLLCHSKIILCAIRIPLMEKHNQFLVQKYDVLKRNRISTYTVANVCNGHFPCFDSRRWTILPWLNFHFNSKKPSCSRSSYFKLMSEQVRIDMEITKTFLDAWLTLVLDHSPHNSSLNYKNPLFKKKTCISKKNV